jgi:hypothetical protein
VSNDLIEAPWLKEPSKKVRNDRIRLQGVIVSAVRQKPPRGIDARFWGGRFGVKNDIVHGSAHGLWYRASPIHVHCGPFLNKTHECRGSMVLLFTEWGNEGVHKIAGIMVKGNIKSTHFGASNTEILLTYRGMKCERCLDSGFHVMDRVVVVYRYLIRRETIVVFGSRPKFGLNWPARVRWMFCVWEK